jgi:hypothetical protein
MFIRETYRVGKVGDCFMSLHRNISLIKWLYNIIAMWIRTRDHSVSTGISIRVFSVMTIQ